MKTTVFRKKVTPRNGNNVFYKYVTTLTSKKNDKVYCDVHFENNNIPKNFPCIVEFDKKDANISHRTINKGTENERVINNLWIKDYIESEYIDESLDDFD